MDFSLLSLILKAPTPTTRIKKPGSTPEARQAALKWNDKSTAIRGLHPAFVETAAGTYHMVGYDFGLYAGTVDGASGVARTDKNRYQLTLTGDENVLAYTMTQADFNKVNA